MALVCQDKFLSLSATVSLVICKGEISPRMKSPVLVHGGSLIWLTGKKEIIFLAARVSLAFASRNIDASYTSAKITNLFVQ